MAARDETPSVPQESLKFGRIPALDSIRAMGAIAVGLWHLYITLPPDVQMRNIWVVWSPIRFLNTAVVIFYLLSGFVLTFPYLKDAPPTYRQFLVARMSRLYIPFAVVLTVALFFYAVTGTGPDFIDGMTFRMGGLPDRFTPAMFARALLMTGLRRDDLMNPALWTLVQEVRISIIFPLLVVLCRKPWMGFGLMTLCYVFVWYTQDTVGRFITFPAITDDFLTTFLTTVYFIPCFIIGHYLARYREPLLRRFVNLRTRWRVLLWIGVAMNFYCLVDYEVRQPFTEIGAVAFLLLVLSSSRLSRWLGVRPLQWLGRVSYSLYITHLPLLFVMKRLMLAHYSLGAIYALFAILVPMLAALSYYFVERPAARFGKMLASRV